MGGRQDLERFLWFDQQLRRQRYPNSATLAKQFEISGKTAQRAIDSFRDRLQATFEYDAARRGYHYQSPFDLPASEDQLIALLVSRKLLADIAAGDLAQELGGIALRLSGLLSLRLPGVVKPDEAFSFRLRQFTPTDPRIFRQTCLALLDSRHLTFNYHSPQAKESTRRTVQPHHLVNYQGTWHLVAYCTLRQDWRDFVISRTTMLKIEDRTFAPRPRREWETALADTYGIFQTRERFEVLLRFTPERSRLVQNQIWHPDQRREFGEDGSLTLAIPASHPAEILMDILAHGAGVEILAPDWLREQARAEIARMAGVYSGDEGAG